MGVYLSQPKRDKQTIVGAGEGFIYAASSVQGWRNSMEDADICCPNLEDGIQLYGVFDGHGGSEVAQFVKSNFSETLLNDPAFKERNFPTSLESTFMMMDEKLRSSEGKAHLQRFMKEKQRTESTAGCTANVSLISEGKLYVANSGDSRTLLSRSGEPMRLSEDHKPNNEIEYKRIKEAGGDVVNGRVNGNLNLSRALGDLQYKKNAEIPQEAQLISAKPDVKVHEINEDDEFILLGCDGVWETMTDQEIITFIRTKIAEQVPINDIVEELLDKLIAPDLLNGSGCDNMTCVLVTLKDYSILQEKFSAEIANQPKEQEDEQQQNSRSSISNLSDDDSVPDEEAKQSPKKAEEPQQNRLGPEDNQQEQSPPQNREHQNEMLVEEEKAMNEDNHKNKENNNKNNENNNSDTENNNNNNNNNDNNQQ